MNESIQKIDYEQLETFLFLLVLLSFFFIIFIKNRFLRFRLNLIYQIQLIKFNFNELVMSQYHSQREEAYGSARSPSRTERDPR